LSRLKPITRESIVHCQSVAQYTAQPVCAVEERGHSILQLHTTLILFFFFKLSSYIVNLTQKPTQVMFLTLTLANITIILIHIFSLSLQTKRKG